MTKLADFWRRQGVIMKIVLAIGAAFVGVIVFGLILTALGVETGDSASKQSSPSSATHSSPAPSPSSSSSPAVTTPPSTSSAPSTSSFAPTPSSSSTAPASTSANSAPASTTSAAASSGLALGPKGNYPVEGPMPSPDSNVVGGYECAQDSASLTFDGELLVTGVKPVTMWSVEFDDAQGNPVGDSASGTVGEGDEGISAHATGGGVKYARVNASGATETMCTVIATK